MNLNPLKVLEGFKVAPPPPSIEEEAIKGESAMQAIIKERDQLRQQAASLRGANKILRGLIAKLLTDRNHLVGTLAIAHAHITQIRHGFFAMEEAVERARKGDAVAEKAQAEIDKPESMSAEQIATRFAHGEHQALAA